VYFILKIEKFSISGVESSFLPENIETILYKSKQNANRIATVSIVVCKMKAA